MTARDEMTEVDLSSAATPAQAAALLEQLQRGAEAAWCAAADAADGGEHERRRATAAVVDVFRDAMWQTFESGLRHPGEDVATFAQRVTEPDPEAGQ